MDARTYWNQYVQENGGAVGVATKLGIPYPTIACICNGSRGIGRATARRMANADSSLDKSILIWVTPMESRTSDFNQDSHSSTEWPELAVHTEKEPANSPPLPSLPAPTFSSSGRGALSQRAMVEAAA